MLVSEIQSVMLKSNPILFNHAVANEMYTAARGGDIEHATRRGENSVSFSPPRIVL